MKRGRKATRNSVFVTLREALENGATGTNQVYRVILLRETRYVIATSPGNATRMAAYDLGAESKLVTLNEVVGTLLPQKTAVVE